MTAWASARHLVAVLLAGPCAEQVREAGADPAAAAADLEVDTLRSRLEAPGRRTA